VAPFFGGLSWVPGKLRPIHLSSPHFQRKLFWCFHPNSTVWTFFVVFFSPSLNDETCVIDVHKGMIIQALISEATIK
jgi:hypothetical protein